MGITYAVHIGAHKTATSYIQNALHQRRPALTRRGVIVATPLTTRDRFAGLPKRRPRTHTGRWLRAMRRRRIWRRLLKELSAEAGARVVVSEENISGGAATIIKRGLVYHRLAERLRFLPRSLNAPGVEFHFAIRSYADFYASCHAEATIQKRKFRELAGRQRERLLRTERRWTDVADELKRCFPKAEIVIWRYEDFRRLAPDIFARLTGVGDLEMTGEGPVVRRSLSLHGLSRVGEAYAEKGAPLSRAEFRAVLADVEAADLGGRYDPWTAEERERLDALYDEDWRALTARSDIVTLS